MIGHIKPNGEEWSYEEKVTITNAVVKAWKAVMPFKSWRLSFRASRRAIPWPS